MNVQCKGKKFVRPLQTLTRLLSGSMSEQDVNADMICAMLRDLVLDEILQPQESAPVAKQVDLDVYEQKAISSATGGERTMLKHLANISTNEQVRGILSHKGHRVHIIGLVISNGADTEIMPCSIEQASYAAREDRQIKIRYLDGKSAGQSKIVGAKSLWAKVMVQ